MSEDDAHEDIHLFETPEEAFQYLRYVGTLADADIDLGETALALALLFLPGVHVDRYRQHINKLCEQVRDEYKSRLRMKEDDTLALRVRILRKIVHEAHGYKGASGGDEDLQNANLIRVIERRRGLSVSIGLLYIILARAAGWQADALNFPGHFLVRLEAGGARVILDPFQEAHEMDAAELRQLLKSVIGTNAELAHEYYNTISHREMLLRLQNNLKKRMVENDEYAQALIIIESMEALAPEDYRVLFDKGILYVKLGQIQQALTTLERYIAETPDMREKQQVAVLLDQIRMGLGLE